MKTLDLGIQRLNVKDTTILGALIAIQIILSKLSITVLGFRIGFAFLALFLMGKWFGPMWAGIAAGISDILSTLVFSTSGGYFFGFTLSAILGGIVYGLFFYRRKISWVRVISSQLIIAIFINAILNTIWVYMIYQMPGKAFKTIIIARMAKEIVMTIIQIILIYFLGNSQNIKRLGQRYLS